MGWNYLVRVRDLGDKNGFALFWFGGLLMGGVLIFHIGVLGMRVVLFFYFFIPKISFKIIIFFKFNGQYRINVYFFFLKIITLLCIT